MTVQYSTIPIPLAKASYCVPVLELERHVRFASIIRRLDQRGVNVAVPKCGQRPGPVAYCSKQQRE